MDERKLIEIITREVLRQLAESGRASGGAPAEPEAFPNEHGKLAREQGPEALSNLKQREAGAEHQQGADQQTEHPFFVHLTSSLYSLSCR